MNEKQEKLCESITELLKEMIITIAPQHSDTGWIEDCEPVIYQKVGACVNNFFDCLSELDS